VAVTLLRLFCQVIKRCYVINVQLNQGFAVSFFHNPLLILLRTILFPSHRFFSLYIYHAPFTLSSMFRSFRKKQVKEPVEEPLRKTSLPDITSQDVQWPEDLVDVAAIRHTPPPEPQLQGAAPISFQPHEPRTTSFHKPFRRFLGRSHDSADRSISSIYMSPHPPSAFHTPSGPTTRVGQRRARVPPKFNLMVSF
jgi:hypothetical protein